MATNMATKRTQKVVVEGETSKNLKVEVPQGTVLGPLMFLSRLTIVSREAKKKQVVRDE